VSGTEKSIKGCEQPACLLTRELNSKLAIIAACCDVLIANAQATSESTKRLDLIRDAVKEMSEQLEHYQCGVLYGSRRERTETLYCLRQVSGRAQNA
jgi:hypothetical protein